MRVLTKPSRWLTARRMHDMVALTLSGHASHRVTLTGFRDLFRMNPPKPGQAFKLRILVSEVHYE